MIEFSKWLLNWRSVVADMSEDSYTPITMKFGDRQYKVLLLSVYDHEVDEDESLLTTSSRDFDSRVALFSRRTRDTGVGRIITNKGKARYVLEQGADALLWGAAIEGVSVDRWMKAARQSHSWRGVERNVKLKLRQRENNLRRKKAIDNRLSELEEEKRSLEGLILATQRKIAADS